MCNMPDDHAQAQMSVFFTFPINLCLILIIFGAVEIREINADCSQFNVRHRDC